MSLRFCQGPVCHTYHTKDRLKGMKGSKTYQTRRRSSMYYGKGNFCDRRCMEDWIHKYIEQGLDHFGRLKEAKHLTEQNAWLKRYRWDYERNNGEAQHYYLNTITKEQRPLTEEQYNDKSYNLNTGE